MSSSGLGHDPEQYVFDFTSRTNDRCAILQRLRAIPLGMNAGRVNGVIDLLQRLTVFAKFLPESIRESYTVEAQVTALAATIRTRKVVSERTIRFWTTWSEELKLVDRRCPSHEYGGHLRNTYTVHFARVMELVSGRAEAGGSGRKRAESISAPGAEATSGLRAETTSAPLNVLNVLESTHHSLSDSASTSGGEPKLPVSDPKAVVVSALRRLSMSEDGSHKAVHLALTRGLTLDAINELIERYQRLTETDTQATVGWLYRWLVGQSSPPQPVTKPQPVRAIRPAVDRAAYERERQAAREAALAAELTMGEQLRRHRESRLNTPVSEVTG